MAHCHTVTDSLFWGHHNYSIEEDFTRSRFATECGAFRPPTEMKISSFSRSLACTGTSKQAVNTVEPDCLSPSSPPLTISPPPLRNHMHRYTHCNNSPPIHSPLYITINKLEPVPYHHHHHPHVVIRFRVWPRRSGFPILNTQVNWNYIVTRHCMAEWAFGFPFE